MSEIISDVLHKYWGFDRFLPLQKQAMEGLCRGRDSIVVLPTGGGKSLCFQAPALFPDPLKGQDGIGKPRARFRGADLPSILTNQRERPEYRSITRLRAIRQTWQKKPERVNIMQLVCGR